MTVFHKLCIPKPQSALATRRMVTLPLLRAILAKSGGWRIALESTAIAFENASFFLLPLWEKVRMRGTRIYARNNLCA